MKGFPVLVTIITISLASIGLAGAEPEEEADSFNPDLSLPSDSWLLASELCERFSVLDAPLNREQFIRNYEASRDVKNLPVITDVDEQLKAWCKKGETALFDDAAFSLRDASSRKALEAGLREVDRAAITAKTRLGSELISSLPIATANDIAVKAIAGFLEKRAKAEFRLFIMKRLRKELCNNSTKNLGVWFRSTCSYLGVDDDEDDILPLSFGPGFRAALVQDVQALPQRVVQQFLSTGTKNELLLRALLESSIVLVRYRHPKHLGQLFEHLENFHCEAGAGQADCNTLQYSLMILGRVLYTIHQERLTELPPVRAAGVLALELERFMAKKPAPPGARKKILDPENLTRAKVEALLEAGRSVQAALKDLDKALGADKDRQEKVLRQVARLADTAVTLVKAASALSDTLNGHSTELIAALQGMRELTTALADGDLARILTTVTSELTTRLDKTKWLPTAVVRTLSFAVDLATARTPEEAKAVIESVAAPVGAWQAKRRDNMFSVTGFVGASYGSDRLDLDGETLELRSMAPVAMLGLDVNFRGWPSPDFRLGLFLSAIDVGTLMSYSFDSDGKSVDGMTADVQETPPLGLAQVFSPGLFLRAGILDTPLTIGVGASLVPNAREVTFDDGEPDDVNIVRFSAFLAMDVTLFPF